MNTPSGPLAANLLALHQRDPQLFARLTLPVASSHTQERDGTTLYQRQQQWYLLDDPAQPPLEPLESPGGPCFLFGMGAGDHLAHLLADPLAPPVTVWERDPWLLLLALSRHDLAEPLASGRLVLRLGIDLLAIREPVRSFRRLLHPLLAQVYRREFTLLEQTAPAPLALVRDGGLYVDDLATFLQQQGYGVYTLDTAGLAQQELLHTVSAGKAALMASINYQNGLAEFCHQAGLPLYCWEIDPFMDRLAPVTVATDHVHLFSYRKANVAEFRQQGFPRAEYLPLAANLATRRPARLTPEEQRRYQAPVSFVGASLVQEAQQHQQTLLQHYQDWRGGDPAAARQEGQSRLDALAAAARADYAHPPLPRLMEQFFGPFQAAMAAQHPTLNLSMLAGERIACEKRLTYVARLAPFGIQVWGDGGWGLVEAHGVRYAGGHADYRDGLAKVYSATTINIDINRAYQPEIVTLRVFDVLACGGFLLAEYSDDLAELFRLGEEVVAYRTLDELVELTAWYLAHPDQAREIARRGQEAVENRHDLADRFRRMFA